MSHRGPWLPGDCERAEWSTVKTCGTWWTCSGSVGIKLLLEVNYIFNNKFFITFPHLHTHSVLSAAVMCFLSSFVKLIRLFTVMRTTWMTGLLYIMTSPYSSVHWIIFPSIAFRVGQHHTCSSSSYTLANQISANIVDHTFSRQYCTWSDCNRHKPNSILIAYGTVCNAT